MSFPSHCWDTTPAGDTSVYRRGATQLDDSQAAVLTLGLQALAQRSVFERDQSHIRAPTRYGVSECAPHTGCLLATPKPSRQSFSTLRELCGHGAAVTKGILCQPGQLSVTHTSIRG